MSRAGAGGNHPGVPPLHPTKGAAASGRCVTEQPGAVGHWGNGGAHMGPNPGVPAASAHQPKQRGRASRTPKKSFSPFPSTPRMSQPIPTGSGAAVQLRATCGTDAATRPGPPVLYEAVLLSVSAIYELPARKPGATIKANNRRNKTRHTLGKTSGRKAELGDAALGTVSWPSHGGCHGATRGPPPCRHAPKGPAPCNYLQGPA